MDLKTTSNQLSLVILAGGMGSRYNGQKQIDPIGPNNEALMEYALFDAMEVGISHFVFVINDRFDESTKEYFKNKIENNGGQVDFVLQTITTEIPTKYKETVTSRQKPWGTAHALLTTKHVLKNPFIIINADDYYGRNAFENARKLIDQNLITPHQYGIVSYELAKTLSENGSVSRGICQIENNELKDVVERTNIFKKNGEIIFEEVSDKGILAQDTAVSMNFWVIHPSIFEAIENKFEKFLEKNATELKAEFFLPQVINEMIHENQIKVLAEKSKDQWFGMTYPQDKITVQNEMTKKIGQEIYPEKLWN